MSTQDHKPGDSDGHKAIKIFLAIGIAVAFIGFFVGTRSESYQTDALSTYPENERPAPSKSTAAKSYGEILEEPLEANAHWAENLEQLKKDRPDLFDEVENTEAELMKSLAERAERRAYAGAPPMVPHPVKQIGDLACVACHTEGVKVRGKVARAMSHEFFANCTQCHTEANSSVPIDPQLGDSVSTENSFEGLPPVARGTTAWVGAPPTIPHEVSMRENCNSCHGPLGYEGMQTTHPWRQNCQQCHAPNADLNQNLPPSNMPFPAID